MMLPRSDRISTGFSTTCWSLVVNRDPSPETRVAALGELCRRYWYPVYAYLRHSDHGPEIAQDITRAFFADLLRPGTTRTHPSTPQRFRDFLLERLRAFLDADWRDLPDADPALPQQSLAELEARLQANHAPTDKPDVVYQRSFAWEVIERALTHLRDEALHSGHIEMYEALLPFLTVEPAAADQNEIAHRLDQRPLALIVALKRLRQRFRELVGRELSDTVESAAELMEEQRTLHGFLHDGS